MGGQAWTKARRKKSRGPGKTQGPGPPARYGPASPLVVRLLNVELFILGVQANKLHIYNLELILNKTGYSHIMENQIFLHFLTWKIFKNIRYL